MDELTAALLRDCIDYDPITGIARWKKTVNSRAVSGSAIGNKRTTGYLKFVFKGKYLLVHRVAWYLENGEWADVIDHINGIRDDNRIENLRACHPHENALNTRRRKDNKCGVKNVSWHKSAKKYQVQLCVNGKDVHFGYFNTLEEAEVAAKMARIEHHKAFANHG